MFRYSLFSQVNVGLSKFADYVTQVYQKLSQSIYHNGFTGRDTISTHINLFTINYPKNHTQYTQSNMILQITIQISCKTHK